MRPRHSFSSRHTGKIKNIRKQKGKYPLIAQKVIQDSDIILEILDARFIQETRNEKFEEEVKKKNKRIIYVFNKADLIDKNNLKLSPELIPYVFVSSTKRKGIKELRNRIKIEAKKVEKKPDDYHKIIVGIIGYPNTGKSSLINSLIGKSSAGVGSDAGFTKSMQKIKLTQNIILLDSPGIIPEKEYSQQDKEKISNHAKLGARSYSQVKEPELVVATIIRDYPGILERTYKINSKGDSEKLLEELGKRKGFLKRGGEVNEDATARLIIKDWQTGKIKL
ncbi:MAG TPA: 50S ribosome-binding GTPase [Candidatus Pacearchaeota archaeon]|nr:50S ribosome-binding GTPase [Candidatus Pacearchaeota archaeon]